MKKMFSDEAALLVRNWEAYQDVLKAQDTLRTQLKQALLSVGQLLRQEDFWTEFWSFQPYNDTNLFLRHENWVRGTENIVTVGFMNASVENLFGGAGQASAYVWVNDVKVPSLVIELRRKFAVKGNGEFDEVLTGKGGFVLQRFLPTCLPDQIDDFETVFVRPVVEFISHYARLEPEITEAVREHLKTAR